MRLGWKQLKDDCGFRIADLSFGCWIPNSCLEITFWQAETPALLDSDDFWLLTLCPMPYALCLLKSPIYNHKSTISIPLLSP